MKIAAAEALAKLARKEVPEYISELYNTQLEFSKEYIIPKPFDRRLIVEVSSAVAQAAIHTGASKLRGFDMEAYRQKLAAALEQ
jgi:malic enzyme